jgi:signal transduction histidine kinase
MRNSLIFKLMGAFLLVIAIGALVISILTSRATQNAFTLYTTRSGQNWALRLAPVLADYYAQNGSWRGVDALLQSEPAVIASPSATLRPGSGTGMGNGMGQGRGMGAQSMGAGMGMMGQRSILVDAQGRVVSDTQNELVGRQLASEDLKNGAPVMVGNQLVGTLLVTPSDFGGAGTPAGEFLASTNQALLSSVIIAGAIALILGAGLFLQITAPLRQLKKAAAGIARGDLNQRVTIRSRDEFGELGQTFNHMAASLADAETQRQHLVADVAHELRTPLSAIQGTLEGIQDGVLPLDEEQVAALYTETMLLNRLVGDLRLLSLAEAGQLKLELQETVPGELIQKVVERLRPQANQRKISLVLDIQDDLPLVVVDADRITQVMNNLLGNALRYTPEGGEITVRAARLTVPAPALQISVTDTGPGIDPAALPLVFDRFYRADKSRTRSSGGSGLGLAIVKQLVEAHGGTVQAQSPAFKNGVESEFGTKMIFTIPVLGA